VPKVAPKNSATITPPCGSTSGVVSQARTEGAVAQALVRGFAGTYTVKWTDRFGTHTLAVPITGTGVR
jgi:hypothetical protein